MGSCASVIALTLLLQACGDSGAQSPPGGQAPPPPEVSVVRLTAEKVTVYEEYIGQTDAADTVELRARIGGLLERQAVPDGAFVRKGDLVFALDREPFATAVAQSRAQLVQAEAQLANSQLNLDRAKPLAAEQALSQQELDGWVTKERSDRATVEVVRAQVRAAELNLSYTEIRAPRDGFLSRAAVRPGGVVTQASTLLATLYSSDPMYVNFVVPEGRVFEFQKRLNGQKAGGSLPFTITLPDSSVYPQAPRLSYVDPTIDPKNGTLQVRLAVPNPQRELKPGFLVRVKVPAYENANAVRIPGRAVTELLGRRSVYIVEEGGKLATRELANPQRAGQDWVVSSGFTPGEMIVVEGTARIRPGLTQVKPVPFKPPAPGGPPKGSPAPQKG